MESDEVYNEVYRLEREVLERGNELEKEKGSVIKRFLHSTFEELYKLNNEISALKQRVPDESDYKMLVQAYAKSGQFVVEDFGEFFRLHNVNYLEGRKTVDWHKKPFIIHDNNRMRRDETIEKFSEIAANENWCIPSSKLAYAVMKTYCTEQKAFQDYQALDLTNLLLCTGLGYNPLVGNDVFATSTRLQLTGNKLKVTHFCGFNELEETVYITGEQKTKERGIFGSKNFFVVKEKDFVEALFGTKDHEYYWRHYSCRGSGRDNDEVFLKSDICGYLIFVTGSDIQEQEDWTYFVFAEAAPQVNRVRLLADK